MSGAGLWLGMLGGQTTTTQVDAAFAFSFTSPFVEAYTWSDVSGFGTKYSAPSTPLPSQGNAVAFTWNRTALFCGTANSTTTPSEILHAYAWSSSGFGTKYANPAALTDGGSGAHARDVLVSNDNSTVFVTHPVTAPYITAYAWSSSGFGTKYANPASGLGGRAVRMTSSQTVVASAYGFSLTAWSWSSSGFGTKYTDLSLGGSATPGFDFHPGDNAVAASMDVNSALRTVAYSFSLAGGFGTKFADPVGLSGRGRGVAFHPSGAALTGMVQGLNFAYAWSSSGFGAKYTDPVNPYGPSSAVPDPISITPSAEAVLLLQVAFPFSVSSGWGTRYAAPVSSANANPNDVHVR